MTLTKISLRLAFIPLEASKSVKHCDGNWCTSVTEVGREAFSGGENRLRDEFIVTKVAGVSVYSIDFSILQFPHHTFRLYQNCTSYSLTIELGHCNFMHICLMVGHLTNQTRFFPFTFYDSLCRQGLFTDLAHNRKRPCVLGKLANRPPPFQEQ